MFADTIHKLLFFFSFFSATPFTQGNTTVNGRSVDQHTTATIKKKEADGEPSMASVERAHVTVGADLRRAGRGRGQGRVGVPH